MNDQFTQGPWERDGTVIWSPSCGQVVCAIAEPEPKCRTVSYEMLKISSKNFEVAMLNADLVLAAPDLLEALQEAIEVIRKIKPHEYGNGTIVRGLAAINKATGEKQ